MSKAIGRKGFIEHTDHRKLSRCIRYEFDETVWILSYWCRECIMLLISVTPTLKIYSATVYEASIIGGFVRGAANGTVYIFSLTKFVRVNT